MKADRSGEEIRFTRTVNGWQGDGRGKIEYFAFTGITGDRIFLVDVGGKFIYVAERDIVDEPPRIREDDLREDR